MGYDMSWEQGPDDAEQAAVDEARRVLDAAVAVRNALPDGEGGRIDSDALTRYGDFDDPRCWAGRTQRYTDAQAAVLAASAAMRMAQTSYFHANIRGMSTLLDLMDRFGMAFEDTSSPTWPNIDDFDVTYEDADVVQYADDYPDEYAAMSEEKKTQVKKFLEAREETRSWHEAADTPGIPFHKFRSNDGWHVLPAECEAAVKLWRKFCEEHTGGEEAVLSAIRAKLNWSTDSGAWWLRWIAFLDGGARRGGFRVW